MSGWAFTCLGIPAPQGSKTAFVNPKTNRAIVTDASKRTKPWRQAVLAAAPAGPKLEGPIAAYVVFTMPRPKSAPKRLTRPATRPDISKLLRAVEDSVTDAGLWGDDALVVEYIRVAKVWTGFDRAALEVPGVLFAAVEMHGDEIDAKAELIQYMVEALTNHQLERNTA